MIIRPTSINREEERGSNILAPMRGIYGNLGIGLLARRHDGRGSTSEEIGGKKTRPKAN